MGKLLAHTSDGKIVLHPSPYLRRRGMWRMSKSLIPAPAASRTSGMKAVALVVPCTLRSTSLMKICRCIRDLPISTSWQTKPRTNRPVGHCRDTLRLSTAGILSGWALQGYPAVGHCKDTWRLGTAGILGGWALQGCFAVGHIRQVVKHCRDTHWLGTAGILGGWALQGTARIFGGWALQGYLVVGH